MIKEIRMYTVVCDGCNVDVNENNEYSCWSEKDYAEADALENDWQEIDGKHYCTDCYTYDNDGEIIVKIKTA